MFIGVNFCAKKATSAFMIVQYELVDVQNTFFSNKRGSHTQRHESLK